MGFISKRLGFVAIAVSLLLGMVACHGQSPSSPGYLPTSTSGVSAPQSVGDDGIGIGRLHDKIISLCGRRLDIIVAGVVRCKFLEKGYGDGRFLLHNHTKGLIFSLLPLTGTRKTKFLVTGIALGTGFFTVRDRHGNILKIRVRVHL